MSKVVKSIAGAVKKVLTKDLTAKIVKKPAVVKKTVEKSVTEKKSPVAQDKVYRRIEERAYELYVARGCHHGSSLKDWYEAERMVMGEIRREL